MIRTGRAADRAEPGCSSTAWLDAILASSDDGIVILDERDRVAELNESAERMLGVPRADARDQPCPELLRPAAERTPHEPEELRIRGADGRLLQVRIAAFEDPPAQRSRVVYLRDVTDLERTRARLRCAEDSDRYQSELLAGVSHEIRAPMTAIVGYADLLLRSGQTRSEREQWRRQIRVNVEVLRRLVGDILDMSRIESGYVSLDHSECDIDDLVRSAVDGFREQADARGIGLTLRGDPAIPPLVTDQLRVRQIVTNLVANAVKFTDSGEVVVELCATSNGSVEISIRDTGVGIDSRLLERIFEPFVQADELRDRDGGSGLGLSISRRLARKLGGDISVTSTPGAGSTFTFRLPPGDALAGRTSEDVQLSVRGCR